MNRNEFNSFDPQAIAHAVLSSNPSIKNIRAGFVFGDVWVACDWCGHDFLIIADNLNECISEVGRQIEGVCHALS